MQRSFLALASAAGAGAIGLTNFIQKAIETAKATTQASVALKNVSGSTSAFVANQKWLVEIAKKYGIEINTLTMGFAKFKAAADISNMSLETQRKIFESVSRASVAFGLSAEDQKGVFMALSQMMSKNKIMAEELRLQLAERMPVAIQAMAKAAGVSVGELDNLMKQGKVLSSDVLPRFADALNEMIATPDTSNLNKSLVDLSNIFTQLVKNLDIAGIFKQGVEAATQLLSNLANHTTAVAGVIKTAFIGMFAKGATNMWGDMVAEYDKTVAAAVKAVEGGQRAIERVEKARLARKEAEATLFAAEEKKKTITTATTAEEIEAIDRELNNARSLLKQKETELYKATENQKRAASKATAEEVKYAAQSGATGWQKAMNVVSHSARMAGQALKAAFMANVWSVAITMAIKLGEAVVSTVAQIIKLRKEVEQTEERINSVSSSEITRLSILKENFQIGKSYNVRAQALQEINRLLGTEYSLATMTHGVYSAINTELRSRIDLLVKQERIANAIKERAEADATIEKLSAKSTTQKVARIGPFAWNTGGLSQSEIRELNAAREKKAKVDKWLEDNFVASDATLPTVTPTAGVGSGSEKIVKIPVEPVIDAQALNDSIRESFLSSLQSGLSQGMDKIKGQVDADRRLREILARQRDTSGDWKMSDIEIQAADLSHLESQMEALRDLFTETGVNLGNALTEKIAESINLKEALRATEIRQEIENLNRDFAGLMWNGANGLMGDIDGVVNAFQRLGEAMEEDATGWERIMAIWNIFSSTASSVIAVMEDIARAKEISAKMEAAAAAQTVNANAGEAASTVGANIAKESGGWAALIAVPVAIGAIMAAFAAIPKFAKGGIVGGSSTQGDKVLARLNSGEGVLTAEGLESLHDAANPRNARKVTVTGVLTGRGRDLMAVIDTETKYRTRTK